MAAGGRRVRCRPRPPTRAAHWQPGAAWHQLCLASPPAHALPATAPRKMPAHPRLMLTIAAASGCRPPRLAGARSPAFFQRPTLHFIHPALPLPARASTSACRLLPLTVDAAFCYSPLPACPPVPPVTHVPAAGGRCMERGGGSGAKLDPQEMSPVRRGAQRAAAGGTAGCRLRLLTLALHVSAAWLRSLETAGSRRYYTPPPTAERATSRGSSGVASREGRCSAPARGRAAGRPRGRGGCSSRGSCPLECRPHAAEPAPAACRRSQSQRGEQRVGHDAVGD